MKIATLIISGVAIAFILLGGLDSLIPEEVAVLKIILLFTFSYTFILALLKGRKGRSNNGPDA